MPKSHSPSHLRMKVTFNVSYEYNADEKALTRDQAIFQATRALNNLFDDIDPSLYDEDTDGMSTMSCGHSIAVSR